ncbi:MAG: hypothetical protein ACLFRY_12660 [Spirochaetia bacterium]
MVVASLVLGILSVALNWILCWLPIVSQILCMILGIIAIVLGVLGMKKFPDKRGMAIAGFILGIVGTVYGLIALLACGITAAAIGKEGQGLLEAVEKAAEEAAEQLGD